MTTTKPKGETTGAEIVPLRQREPLPDDVVLAIAAGNLAPLEPKLRAIAIRTICEDGNLPLSLSPVILIPGDNGTLKPYVTAIGASWVADNKRVSTKILSTEMTKDLYIVRMMAVAGDGRSVEDIGAVAIGGLGGQNLGNALMKATTKAYRRTVLRLSGLPLTDDDEGTGPPRRIDYETGEIIEAEGTVVTPSPAGKPNDDPRSVAAKRLFATIRERYGKDQPLRDIGHDLVCTRFGLDSTTEATEAQLREVAAAVKGWNAQDAELGLASIRLIADCPNASTLIDLGVHFDQIKVSDPFVHAALADALQRADQREADAAPDMADVDGIIDAMVQM
jgi:hypothetical protein